MKIGHYLIICLSILLLLKKNEKHPFSGKLYHVYNDNKHKKLKIKKKQKEENSLKK